MNLDGPQVFNPKPEGIQRVKRTPIIVVAVCFCFLLIFLVFKVSGKRERAEQAKRQTQSSPVLETADEKWFNDSKYDELRASGDAHKTNHTELTGNTLETKRNNAFQPSSSNTIKSRDTLDDPGQDVSIESSRLYSDAIKSPAIVALTSESNYSSSMSMDNERPVGSWAQNNEGVKKSSKEAFLSEVDTGSNYLPYRLESPLSPFELKAGTVIPAALTQTINSDLPGHVTAIVRENVYDTVTGKRLLICKGARLIGIYQSQNISHGQNRLLLAWQRLIFQDGKSIDLGRMEAADSTGAGLHDKVDFHYGRIFGNALMLSVLGSAYEFLTPDSAKEDTAQTVASNVGQQVAQATSRLTEKNIDISPTIIIRAGSKFNVVVMRDMVLEEIKND